MITLAEITARVMELPDGERATLVTDLLRSLGFSGAVQASHGSETSHEGLVILDQLEQAVGH